MDEHEGIRANPEKDRLQIILEPLSCGAKRERLNQFDGPLLPPIILSDPGRGV
jgi:hypothetical protein